MKIFIRRLTIILFFLFAAIALHRYFIKSWIPYYQEKLYKKPRPLLIEALGFFKDNLHEKKALDLGAGVGNDTAYLLSQGWEVWANDAEEEAITLIKSRKDIQPYVHNLTLMHKGFSDLAWHALPQFKLIYAGYSLPFVSAPEFAPIWNNIVQAIRSGGIFAGHFFDPGHGAFNWWTRRNMTFFTREQVYDLFKGFQIESFKEIYEKNANGIWDHSYEVIARKL